MTFCREEAARQGALPLAALPGQVGRRVRGAGWLITGKLVSTKRGEPRPAKGRLWQSPGR